MELLLTLIAGSQTALLQGLRRIDDLARVSILSALVAASAGILAVYCLGEDGVLWFVLTAPAVNFLVASYYAARLPQVRRRPYDLAAIQQQWLAMLKLGIPLMSAGLLTLITQLAVRSIVLRELGLEASGYFQAAWAISMTYVGFVLNAMVMDYFPRLTKAISDHDRAKKTRQRASRDGPAASRAGADGHDYTCAVGNPFALCTKVSVPRRRYSDGKCWVTSSRWPACPCFYFLATGHGGVAIGIQCVWSAAYLGALVLGINEFGLVMAGVGFWIAYLIYFVVVALVANKLIGFNLTKRNWCLTFTLLLVGSFVIFLAAESPSKSYLVGLIAAFFLAIYSVRRLNHLIDLTGWLRLKLL